MDNGFCRYFSVYLFVYYIYSVNVIFFGLFFILSILYMLYVIKFEYIIKGCKYIFIDFVKILKFWVLIFLNFD